MDDYTRRLPRSDVFHVTTYLPIARVLEYSMSLPRRYGQKQSRCVMYHHRDSRRKGARHVRLVVHSYNTRQAGHTSAVILAGVPGIQRTHGMSYDTTYTTIGCFYDILQRRYVCWCTCTALMAQKRCYDILF